VYSYYNSSQTLCIKCWDSAFRTEFEHLILRFKATFDKGSRSRDQWIQAILIQHFALNFSISYRDLGRLYTWVQGPGTNEFKQILLVESLKLVPRPLDEGARPKSGKLRLDLHGTSFGGKINWFGPNNRKCPYFANTTERGVRGERQGDFMDTFNV
jgi:hypothetical protein